MCVVACLKDEPTHEQAEEECNRKAKRPESVDSWLKVVIHFVNLLLNEVPGEVFRRGLLPYVLFVFLF